MTQNGDGPPEYSKHGMFFRLKPGQPKRPMMYDGFRDQFAKMHGGLTNALLTCWTSNGMFYAPKNALQIALQVLPFFPMIDEHATKIEKAVNDLLQKTDGSITPDMKPALNSYKSQLQRRRKERPCTKEADFSPVSYPSYAELTTGWQAEEGGAGQGRGRGSSQSRRRSADQEGGGAGQERGGGSYQARGRRCRRQNGRRPACRNQARSQGRDADAVLECRPQGPAREARAEPRRT